MCITYSQGHWFPATASGAKQQAMGSLKIVGAEGEFLAKAIGARPYLNKKGGSEDRRPSWSRCSAGNCVALLMAMK